MKYKYVDIINAHKKVSTLVKRVTMKTQLLNRVARVYTSSADTVYPRDNYKSISKFSQQRPIYFP